MIQAEEYIASLKNTINSHKIRSVKEVANDITNYATKITEIINAYEVLFTIAGSFKVEASITQETLNGLVDMLPVLDAPTGLTYEKYIDFTKMTAVNFEALDTTGVINKNWGIIAPV